MTLPTPALVAQGLDEILPDWEARIVSATQIVYASYPLTLTQAIRLTREARYARHGWWLPNEERVIPSTYAVDVLGVVSAL